MHLRPCFSWLWHLDVNPFSLSSGSQAASLMADAPTQLQHARAVVDMYMERAKEGAKSALATLDDAEYKELK